MSKQDRQGARTVTDLERRLNTKKTFAEAMGLAQDAKKVAEAANEQAKKAQESVDGIDHEAVWTRLTEDGKQQGLFKENGVIYAHVQYLKGGTIAAELIDGSTLIIKKGAVIAGWDVDGNSVFKKPAGGTYGQGTFMSTGTDNPYAIGGSNKIPGWVFGAGGKFGVTKDGVVYANDVHLTGEVNASGGMIGDWDIQEGYLTSTKNVDIKMTSGTATWKQKTYWEPDGIRIVLTYQNGNPVPAIKELENKIYWYQLAGLNVASAFAE